MDVRILPLYNPHNTHDHPTQCCCFHIIICWYCHITNDPARNVGCYCPTRNNRHQSLAWGYRPANPKRSHPAQLLERILWGLFRDEATLNDLIVFKAFFSNRHFNIKVPGVPFPLIAAAANLDVNVMKFLLENGANPLFEDTDQDSFPEEFLPMTALKMVERKLEDDPRYIEHLLLLQSYSSGL